MSIVTREQKLSEPSVNPDQPQLLLTGITDKATTQSNLEDKSLPGTTTSALPGTTLPKHENSDHNVSIPSSSSSNQVRKHNLRNCSVSIIRLTTEVITKYTKAPVVKLEAIVSCDPSMRKCTNQWPVSKCKISGHPQSNKHTFHVKCHILRKCTRKLYLKCRIANCKQAYRSFHSVQALNVHHRIFHPRILFRCRFCPKIHHTPSSDTYHKYKHQQPTFSCPKCDRSFIFNSKLQQHRRVHIKQRLYKCFYGGCTRSYKYLQDLVRHANSHLSKKFECPLCDYTSDQKHLLKRHLAIHEGIMLINALSISTKIMRNKLNAATIPRVYGEAWFTSTCLCGKCKHFHLINTSICQCACILSLVMHNNSRNTIKHDNLNRPIDHKEMDSCPWNDRCDYIELDHFTNLNQNNYNLITMQLNIHSILAHQQELSQLLRYLERKGSHVDIILLCETFLTKKTEKMVNIPGYKLIGNHHPTRKGGGVCILLNENIPYKRKHDLNIFEEGILESVFMEIRVKNGRKIIVGSMYKPLNAKSKQLIDGLETLISKVRSNQRKDTPEVIIGIDQNLDLLKGQIHLPTRHFIDRID